MAPLEGERSSQPLSADASDEENRNDSTRESSEATTWYYRMEEDEDEDEEDPDYEDEPDEEDEDDFRGVNDRDIEILMENGGDDDEDEEDEDEIQGVTDEQRLFNIVRTGARTGLLTRRQLIALMQSPDLTSVLFQDNPRDDAEFLNNWPFNRSLTPKDPDRFPKVPSEQGLKLMRSGAFGANDYNPRAKRPLAVRMLERELALGNREDRIRNNALINQSLLPKSRAEKIIHFDDPVYSGQFSDDGNFFFACSQDFKVRMYDTSSPYNWKHYKTVSYPWGQWTLTDASLSPDNKWLAYTSIQSMVSIAPTDPNDTGDPYTLDLDNSPLQGYHRRGFGIWSVRFSGDGRELVAGTSAASIVVYDIESRTVLHHVRGHSDDVNAVCFADKMSPHILYSGSDDTTIKVWDRRSMGDHREAGAFVGHIEGLTYIDSKGDGRYILSNGKDQSMKLWDIRMAMSTDRFNELDPTAHANTSGFDYRGGIYDDEDWDVHPHDNSLVTFRGHKVLRTLIRCHFSPPMSTNSRYVYSGSTDGKVYIWNLDASLAGIIDVKKATMRTRPMDNRRRAYHSDEPSNWRTCVRDASWHPTAPLLVASAWNGYNMARGTCTLHSYNDNVDDEGEPPMGQSVNNLLKEQPELYQNSTYTNGLLLG